MLFLPVQVLLFPYRLTGTLGFSTWRPNGEKLLGRVPSTTPAFTRQGCMRNVMISTQGLQYVDTMRLNVTCASCHCATRDWFNPRDAAQQLPLLDCPDSTDDLYQADSRDSGGGDTPLQLTPYQYRPSLAALKTLVLGAYSRSG